MTSIKHTLATAASSVALLLSGTACAQQQTPTPVDNTKVAAADVELAGPALWKVADEDTTVYLFGTVHALPKEVEWFRGPVADALQSSETLVTEVRVDPAVMAGMQETILGMAMLPEGETVRAKLSPDQLETYEGAMTKLGLPAGAFDRFEPWYGAMMLSMLPLLQQGYAADAGVEAVLTKAADGKELGELETMQYQLGLFDTLPMETQLSYLVETAEQVDTITASLDAMVAEWIEGDADQLAVLMNEEMTDPVILETLLYQRNRTWAEWIDERLDTPGTVFLAVGAGHLAGKQSVQDALTQRGIEVLRVQ